MAGVIGLVPTTSLHVFGRSRGLSLRRRCNPPASRLRPGSQVSVMLEAELAQRRVTVGTAAQRPVVFAIALFDRQIVDAGDAQAHQAVLVEFPVLVAVAAEPVAAVVMPLIGEAHGDAVVAEGPHFLDQPVVELAVPFAGEEGFDLLAALNELGAIAPA